MNKKKTFHARRFVGTVFLFAVAAVLCLLSAQGSFAYQNPVAPPPPDEGTITSSIPTFSMKTALTIYTDPAMTAPDRALMGLCAGQARIS